MGDRKSRPNPLTEEQVIRALDRLADRWPEGYVLFSWSGSLHLLRPGAESDFGGIYESKIAATFPGIVNDGGDPDHAFEEVLSDGE